MRRENDRRTTRASEVSGQETTKRVHLQSQMHALLSYRDSYGFTILGGASANVYGSPLGHFTAALVGSNIPAGLFL